MKRYALVDKTNGNIDSIMFWGDGREIPTDYPMEVNQTVVVVEDDNIDCFINCYDLINEQFHIKLKVDVDVEKIKLYDGIANITIQYPEQITETCKLTVDNETLDVDVIDGNATIQYCSNTIGFNKITIESTSFFGKEVVYVEVI